MYALATLNQQYSDKDNSLAGIIHLDLKYVIVLIIYNIAILILVGLLTIF